MAFIAILDHNHAQILFGSLFMCFCTAYIARIISSRYTHREKESAATSFQTPPPQPLINFDATSKDPQAYRPFRHGVNHITMGIRSLDWNEWIEMDSDFMKYHDVKVSELKKDFSARVQYVSTPRVRDACFEVLEELSKYLTRRYPNTFTFGSGYIHNTLSRERFAYPAKNPAEALATAAKLIQDDIVLMAENTDGEYHLDAGAVCLPGFWRLKEKFRMSLDTLHIEAGVPHYEAKLQKSMNRFFKKMTPEKGVVRNNFFIQLDDGLHWSHRMGNQNGSEVASWKTADAANLTIHDLHFRSERQTLRRLPRSGVLMFTIRTYFLPVTTISKEPGVPGRLVEAIRAWDETVATYKGREKWENILLPYLDAQHKMQLENGNMEKQIEDRFPF